MENLIFQLKILDSIIIYFYQNVSLNIKLLFQILFQYSCLLKKILEISQILQIYQKYYFNNLMQYIK